MGFQPLTEHESEKGRRGRILAELPLMPLQFGSLTFRHTGRQNGVCAFTAGVRLRATLEAVMRRVGRRAEGIRFALASFPTLPPQFGSGRPNAVPNGDFLRRPFVGPGIALPFCE